MALPDQPSDPTPLRPNESRAVGGGEFVFAEPAEIPALWGEQDRVVWAEGEGLLIAGPDGVGKTSVMQQLLLHRIGVHDGPFLSLNVQPAGGKQLYIAADRPRQASRSFRRMVDTDDYDLYDLLEEHVVVWRGPLPFDIGERPHNRLAEFARQLDCTSIYIDSLKDVALDLSKDEIGSRVNLAFQEVIAAGLDLCAAHHQRKEQQGAGKPRKLADVYGSRWLTAGMGSVILLWGDAGDAVIDLSHLKQPAEDIGPLTIVHDHRRGRTTVQQHITVEELLGKTPHGLTVADAASIVYAGGDKATPNQVEKARRRLEGLVGKGIAERRDDPDGLPRYFERTGP